MKNLVSRGIATLTATSLSLAAVPAFAIGGPGGDNGMHFGFGLRARGDRGGVAVEARLEAMTERCNEMDEGDQKDRCDKMALKLSERLEARENRQNDEDGEEGNHERPNKPTVDTIDDHVENIMTRSINAVAKMARRVCSGDETVTFSECMDDVKANLISKISGWIDAAFQAEVEANANAS